MRPTIQRLLVCAGSVLALGCHAPWSNGPNFNQSGPLPGRTPRNNTDATPATFVTTAEKPQQPERVMGGEPPRAGAATLNPEASPPNAEPDLTNVLAQLEQVGNLDPAAQKRLITQLRQTKPSLWPLVTEQFKASLAYHEQLDAKRASLEQQNVDDPIFARPSSEIGGLVDPRRLGRLSKSSEESTVAAATSVAETPGVPGEFQAAESAIPINADDRARLAFDSAERVDPKRQLTDAKSITQANFETDRTADVETPTILTPRADPPIQPMTPIGASNGDEPGDWKQLIVQAAADLKARVASSPQSTAEVHQHVTLRMLRLLEGKTEEALEPIPGISPVEQDYWSRQLFALATYLDHHQQPEEKRRAAASVTHLDEAVAKLRELGSLSLRNLTFCKTVYNFGAFEPFPDDRFAPGEQVSIYVEVENYRSQSTEKGYHTLLAGTYEIVDVQGKRIAGGEFPDVEDHCRSRRRDFHIEYGLVLPANLAPGAHRLRLVVKDRQSDKLGSAELAFDVGEAEPK